MPVRVPATYAPRSRTPGLTGPIIRSPPGTALRKATTAAPVPARAPTQIPAQAPVLPAAAPGPFPNVNFPRLPATYFQPRADLSPQSLLGPLGRVVPKGLQRGDIPLLEIGLNAEQLANAVRFLQAGTDVLQQTGRQIGTAPASQLARETAMARLQSAGGGLRSQQSLALEDAARGLSEDFARRGLGGGVPALGLAELRAQGGAGIAAAQEQATERALAQLQEIAAREEAERLAVSQALAQLFAETEFGPVDLSALTQGVRRGYTPVGRTANF